MPQTITPQCVLGVIEELIQPNDELLTELSALEPMLDEVKLFVERWAQHPESLPPDYQPQHRLPSLLRDKGLVPLTPEVVEIFHRVEVRNGTLRIRQ